jgi:DNA ligase-associated metallophosphoesterase
LNGPRTQSAPSPNGPSKTGVGALIAGEGWGGGSKRGTELSITTVSLHADCLGALYWPEHGLLVVADLHLEKGSSFARRGQLLPPYDTTETLARLARLIARYAPRVVVALGDNFHDGGGPGRLSGKDRVTLTALQRGREWIWIAGNHDPDPPEGIGGAFAETLPIGPLTFRHKPSPDAPDGEIAGHLHPVARVAQRGRAVSRRCFATDGKALVMPAFGAYTGGLNIRDRTFLAVFAARKYRAHMLGDDRLYAFAASRCLVD